MLLKVSPEAAVHLHRSRLGAGVAGVCALTMALAALLDVVPDRVAVEACVLLAVVTAAFYGLLASGRTLRLADPSLAMAQIASLYVLLGWLTWRSGGTPAALSVLYLVVTLYGILRLDAGRLVIVCAIALVLHGVAIFMLVDSGARLSMGATWTQYGALVLGMLWSAWAATSVSRLRERVADTHGRLIEAEATAQDRATRDALTGTYGRPMLAESLEREAARASRTSNALCVARVDLDRMRAVNEKFGNEAGDAVIARFAQVATRVARDVDTFGRWGGKAFLIIMPDTGYDKAIIGAERLRAAIEKEMFPEASEDWRITCSAGLAQYRNGEPLARVLERAEAALSYAKAAGRNRVIAFDHDGKPLQAQPR